MRRRLVKFGAGLLLVGALMVSILLSSDYVFRKLVTALLPPELEIQQISGDLSGPIEVADLKFQSESQIVVINSARLHWSPASLLRGTAQIRALEIDRVELTLISSEAPPEPEPFEWPALQSPLGIELSKAQINEFVLNQPESELAFSDVSSSAAWHGADLSIEANASSSFGTIGLTSNLETQRPYAHTINVTCDCQDAGQLRLDMQGRLSEVVATITRGSIGASEEGKELLRATLRDLDGRPGWNVRLGVARTDIESLPMDIALTSEGNLEHHSIRGTVVTDSQQLDFALPEVTYSRKTVSLKAAKISLPEMSLSATVTGMIPLDPEQSGLNIDASWKLQGDHPVSGQFSATGALSNYGGTFTASNANGDQAVAQLKGDLEHALAESMQLNSGSGEVNLSGSARWTPALTWEANGSAEEFDPGVWFSNWPGEISAQIAAQGKSNEATARIDGIAGELRGRPVSGYISGSARGELIEADTQLRSGDTRLVVNGTYDGRIEGEANISALDLSHWVVDATGTINSQFKLAGTLREPNLAGALSARNVSYDGLRVGQLTLSAEPRNGGHALSVEADAIVVPNSDISQVRFDLSGTPDAHHFTLDADTTQGRIDLEADGVYAADTFSMTMQRLDWTTPSTGKWTLDKQMTTTISPQLITLSAACLQQDDAFICSEGEWDSVSQGGRGNITAKHVPVNLFLAAAAPEQSITSDSHLSATFNLTSNAGEPKIALNFNVSPGALQLTPDVEIALQEMTAAAQGDLNQLDLNAQIRIDDTRANMSGTLTSLLSDGKVELTGQAQVPDLSIYDSFLQPVTGLTGSASADFTASGAMANPIVSGSLMVDEVGARIADLGITLSATSLEAEIDRQSARVSATSQSGEGQIDVSGDLSWEDELAGRMTVSGAAFQAVHLPELDLVASPDVVVEVDGSRIKVSGKVDIPTAEVRLKSINSSVPVSTDVVIVDSTESPAPESMPIEADLNVTLGDAVRLRGFGLDVGLEGNLRVEEQPGRPSRGFGRIDLEGTYVAFGQKLEISSGRLLYSGDPLGDPAIDLRAQRTVEDIEAGITVSGRALSPTLEIYSNPSMDQSEALAYLVLGRPLNAAGNGDSDLLGAAALGLGVAGSNRILGKLASGGGFASIGVANRQDLGGTAFSLARYLSPRLYLSYSVGLEKPIDLVELRYQLSRRWALETEVGEETRGAIKYKIEVGKPGDAPE